MNPVKRADLPYQQIPHPGGRGTQWAITCGSCGTTASLGQQDMGGKLLAEQLPKRARLNGWEPGKKSSDHRCPGCLMRASTKTMRKPPVLAVVPPSQEPAMAVPAPKDEPRQMGREDRRVIFAKLEEVYVDEKTGYEVGWTDERVANDLGVPRAWVSAMREENFGPARSEALDNALQEAREVAGQIQAIKTRVDELQRDMVVLVERQAKVEANIERLSRVYR